MVHFILGLCMAGSVRYSVCRMQPAARQRACATQPGTAARCGDPTLWYETRYVLARPLLFLPRRVEAGRVWPVQCGWLL